MKPIWEAHDEGGYGRDKVILRAERACDVCKEERMCLGFDPSDEEYHAIFICEHCAHRAFTDGTLPTGSDGT